MEQQRFKKKGIELYQRACWHRGVLKKRAVVDPPSPEVLEREQQAHAAAAEVFGELVGVVEWGPDVVVDAVTSTRQSRLIAAGHMLADAWRCLMQGPETTVESMNALISVFTKKA